MEYAWGEIPSAARSRPCWPSAFPPMAYTNLPNPAPPAQNMSPQLDSSWRWPPITSSSAFPLLTETNLPSQSPPARYMSPQLDSSWRWPPITSSSAFPLLTENPQLDSSWRWPPITSSSAFPLLTENPQLDSSWRWPPITSSSAFPLLTEMNLPSQSPPAHMIPQSDSFSPLWSPSSCSSARPLLPPELVNPSLPTQNMIPPWDFSFRQQPPQSHAGDSYMQLWNLSYPDSCQGLAPEAFTNTPHPVNAEEEEFDTEVPQGNFQRGNEGKIDHIRSNDDELMKLNYPPDGGIGCRTIGKIHVSNRVIGKGSNGTIVLQGYYEGRFVAVKRLVRDHHDDALNEIRHLIVSDHHPNIVRYYGVERDQDFVYLALELCTCSLDDLIQAHTDSSNKPAFPNVPASMVGSTYKLDSVGDAMQDVKLWRADGHPSPLLLKLMRDMVSGLAHLHALGIIHRDLKPQNVLFTKNQPLSAQLSDMGISISLPKDKSSLGFHATGCGSSGWRAPELIHHGGRQKRAMDMFSLGCVLFFCITRGGHPFGEPLEREYQIMNNGMNLSSVEFIPEAVHLFSRLLIPNPEFRPKASDVLHHPIFWNSEMRLFFLHHVSNRVEWAPSSDPLLVALESIAPKVFTGNWHSKIEAEVMAHLRRWRSYDGGRVRDLLRVVRNNVNHHMEVPKKVQEILGPFPDGLDAYFTRRFPRLLIASYEVVSQFCKEEPHFRKYFPSDAL